MIAKFTMPAGARITVVLKDGTELQTADVDYLLCTPFFYSSLGPGELLHGAIESNIGEKTDSFSLVVMGSTGRTRRQDREEEAKSAIPIIDKRRSSDIRISKKKGNHAVKAVIS